MVKLYTFLIALLLPFFAFSKKMAMEISYAEFMNPQRESYLELYFALDGYSVDYVKDSEGNFKGGVEITVQIFKGSEFVTGDKFRILSPETKDTLSLFTQRFLHQQRFLLDNGSYTMKLDIKDINEPEEVYKLEQPVEVALARQTALTSSDLIFLDSFKPSVSKNAFSKSGYDLVPMVSSGALFLTEDIKKLSFYIEFYNFDRTIGTDSAYLLRYYIYDVNRNVVLNKYASYSKKEAKQVQPLLYSFNIENLPSGNYQLKIEAKDKKGNTLISRESFFYRKNSSEEPLITGNLEDTDITGTFVDRLGGFDSVYQYINYLHPISSDAEINYQNSLIESRDIDNMKRYFYTFWSNKNDANPEGEWNEYHKKVKIANQYFSSKIRKGYMTDRGRIFLVYGKPDIKEDRKFEPGLHPYEIWQFNRINSPYAMNQTNKIFVFAEFQPSTNEYELIHSTAIGELNNRRWRIDLSQGANGIVPDLDESGASDLDPFGSRLNNNLIFNSANPDR